MTFVDTRETEQNGNLFFFFFFEWLDWVGYNTGSTIDLKTWTTSGADIIMCNSF